MRAGHGTGAGVMDFLASSYRVFKDLPSRRADYKHYSTSDDPPFPLKYCSTRWIGNIEAVERIISCLPHLRSYVQAMQAKVTEPQSSSYRTMKAFLDDPLLKARLSFFLTIARDLESFLTEFQADHPKIPFLYKALKDLLNIFMDRLFKPEVLIRQKNTSSRLALSFTEDNLLPRKAIDVGYVHTSNSI